MSTHNKAIALKVVGPLRMAIGKTMDVELAKYRERGYTYEDIGDMCGVSRNVIASAVLGQWDRISMDMIMIIAVGLGFYAQVLKALSDALSELSV